MGIEKILIWIPLSNPPAGKLCIGPQSDAQLQRITTYKLPAFLTGDSQAARSFLCFDRVIRRLRKFSAYFFPLGIEKVAEMAADFFKAIQKIYRIYANQIVALRF
ncbi:hypothetical protein [Kosakonia sp. Marseille-Q7440]